MNTEMQSKASTERPTPDSRRPLRIGLPATFVDVLFCLLAIFMVSTFMGLHSYVDPPQELMLPPLDLSELEAEDESTVSNARDLIIISISPGSNGSPSFFVDSKEVGLEALGAILQESTPREACLRVDGETRHATEMSVIELCRRKGVQLISFAYSPSGSREG